MLKILFLWVVAGTVSSEVLLVHDTSNQSAKLFYEKTLKDARVSFKVHNVDSQGIVPLSLMREVDLVIYESSNNQNAMFDRSQKAELAKYLQNDGKLFLTGQYLGEALSDSLYGRFDSLYLRVAYSGNKSGMSRIEGNSGDYIGSGFNFSLNSCCADTMTSSGISVFYNSSGGDQRVIGVRSNSVGNFTSYRAVWYGFGLDQISDPSKATQILKRTMQWLR